MQICGIDPSSKSGSIGITVIKDAELVICAAVNFKECLEIAWDTENQVVFIETFRTKRPWHGKGCDISPATKEIIATNVGIGIGAMICFAGFISARANVRTVYPSDTKLSRGCIFSLTGYDTSDNQNARDSFIIAYQGYRLVESEILAHASNGG